MKIKLFYGHNEYGTFTANLEDDVNFWLKKWQDTIEIVEIKHRTTGSFHVMIMIVYKLKS